MKKYLIIALIVVIGLVVAYLTFVIAAIKFVFGAVMLGVAAIAVLAIWIWWKVRD